MTVREIVLAAIGGPEHFAVRRSPRPPLPHGSIRVRNIAIGVNFIDIYQRKGLYPIGVPAVLGQEARASSRKPPSARRSARATASLIFRAPALMPMKRSSTPAGRR